MKRTYNTAKEGGTRRKGVESRIISFINKIREIDYKYLPKPSLRKTDSAAHSKALSVWRKKVQDACANEKKYLAAEEKIQISSYKKLMTRYRSSLKSMKFLHPKFEIQLDALKVRYRSKADYIEVYRTDVVSLRNMLKEAKSLLSTELRDKPNERWAYTQVSRLDYEHPALRYMRLNSDQMAIFKQDGVTNLAARQKKDNRLLVPFNKINLEFKRIAERYAVLDYASVVLAVMWFTGRRPIEIFLTGNFEPVGADKILFSGQAKTKGREESPYEIPVWYDAKALRGMVSHIRNEKQDSLDGKTADEINGRTSSTLNDRVKSIFGHGDVEAYDLRRAYGVYTEMLLNNNSDTRSKYIGQILGHSEKDINTARSYDTVIVDMGGPDEGALIQKEKDEQESIKEKLLSRLVVMEADGLLKTKAFVRIHAKVIEMVQRGETKFNISRIGEYSGCNRLAIKDFLTKVDLSI